MADRPQTFVVLLSAFAIAIIFAGGAGILAATGVAWYLFSGQWNVAASEPHFPPVRWAAEQVYRSSVAHHTDPIAPAALEGADRSKGAQLYAQNCVRCHSAPGGELPDWVEGMRPMPPHLAEVGTSFDAAEIVWILQNGIKMSGMPSWRHVLSDQDLLAVAAFVKELPEVSPDRYADLLQSEEQAESNAQPRETGEAAQKEQLDQTAQSSQAVEPDQTSKSDQQAKTSETTEPAAEVEAATNASPASAEQTQEQEQSEPAGPAATVEMTNALTYEPATVTVKVGDTVRWTNPSDVRHTVTADESKASDPANVVLPDEAEPFDSGNIEPGGSWSYTFQTAGRYKYFCIPHEAAGMIGEVIVEE